VLVKPANARQQTDGKTHVGGEEHIAAQQRSGVGDRFGVGLDRKDNTVAFRLDSPGKDGIAEVGQPASEPLQPIRTNTTVIVRDCSVCRLDAFQSPVRRGGDAGLWTGNVNRVQTPGLE
jgi:hypothetical protein